MRIITITKDEFYLGSVPSVTLCDDDTGAQTTYSLTLTDGWIREGDTWDEERACNVATSKARSHVGAVIDAVADDADARSFVVHAHTNYVRVIRAAAVTTASARLHRRATRQGHALIKALGAHGRRLLSNDLLDPRKDGARAKAVA